METRSQRRANQTQRSPYQHPAPQSAPTSPSSSAYQSSASLASLAAYNANASASSYAQQHPQTQQQQQPYPSMQLQTQQTGLASAPLPSPSSTTQPGAYFGSLTQQPPTSHPSHAQHLRIPQGQQYAVGAGGSAGAFLGQRGGDGGGTPETAPFLKDFNLVAEAAKRAQMACLTRDLGDVGL